MPKYLPKSIVCLREGYTRQALLVDVVAGITVGVIALPLAMAFGIGSIPDNVVRAEGVSPPAMGLYTAVVAGFLISALGGSRVQIGGPTGAFIVIVSGIAAHHGYAGLATATIMAGAIIIFMGVLRLGALIKFIPYPVTTGFTSGIAVIIFSSQIKDLVGLKMGDVPPEFVDKWREYFANAMNLTPAAACIGIGSVALILLMRRIVPRSPGMIVAVVVASLAVWLLDLHGVATIGSKFGGIPRSLPTPRLPPFSFGLVRELIPSALTIAMLAAIESLLSAVVSDGMTGNRHKSDCELVAQGVANIGSVLFGGIPATGAIARTTANIKSGGKTPVSGMVHALVLLVIMMAAAPLASHIPLAALAAVLVVVAWNMAEIDHFRYILRAPGSDIAVLLTTFGLTVFTDLTVAVGVGMVLASILFMKRMAEVSNISAITREFSDADEEIGELKDPNAVADRELPPGVEVYEVNGPLFFGVADRLKDTLRTLERPPRVFVLRMRRVPAIDASGLHALEEFYDKCRRQGTILLLSGVHAQPLVAFHRARFDERLDPDSMFGSLDDALDRAREIIGVEPAERPIDAVPEVARDRTSAKLPSKSA
jgi:sulfate permease, SulP family